jgi:hypothetical protein
MEENRQPFVFLLGGCAVHKKVGCFPSPELDALGLDIWVAGASGKYFSAIDSRPLPSNVRMFIFVTDDDLGESDGGLRRCRAIRRSETAARLARRDRTPPCLTRPCTRSPREGCPPSRAFFMENKRPGLFGPHRVAFPGRRAGTKRRG